jgi:ureidoglycolate lyase
MRLRATPISEESFRPFGALVPRPSEAGRTSLEAMIESDGAAARLSASLTVIDPDAPPMLAPKMERHPHSAQMFLPIAVERYLVVVAPDRGGAPDPAGARAFVVPGDLGIVYAIDRWHCPMRVLESRGSFVVLMAMSGTERDEAWAELPEPLEIEIA